MIKELVPCGNPIIKELIGTTDRYIRCGEFKPSIRDGVKYCSWCHINPVPKNRRDYCSIECRESCNLFCAPQTDSGLAFLLATRGLSCPSCDYSWEETFNEKREKRIVHLSRSIASPSPYLSKSYYQELRNEVAFLLSGGISFGLVKSAKWDFPKGKTIEIDHIIPVALGGTTLGFENLQAICSDCHSRKTRLDMIDIRNSKAHLKAPAKQLDEPLKGGLETCPKRGKHPELLSQGDAVSVNG